MHRLTPADTHIHTENTNQAIPGCQGRVVEIGRTALRFTSAKEKLLDAARVEHAYYLVMEKEWRGRHCALSETLSD